MNSYDLHQPAGPAIGGAHHLQSPIGQPRISRRAALLTWIAGTAPLVLLTACAGAVGATPARGRGAGPDQTAQVAAAGASAATESVRQELPACILTPRQSEGPYFVDGRLHRSDIRSDPADGSVRAGIPLRLTLQVSQVTGSACSPLAGTYVDVWQCDALGVYSDVDDRSTGTRAGTSTFLRGYQVTDESGQVQFTTIFPGWYGGRAVHIHFKIRTALDTVSSREMVSQVYFDDAQIDQIHALPPYAARGPRTVRNDRDFLFRQGGDKLIVPISPDADGYAGTFNLGVDFA